MIVVDASLIVGAVSPDEASPEVIARVGAAFEGGAVAPALFAYEVQNVLVMKERRGGLSATDRDRVATAIAGLPITIRAFDPARMRGEITSLASRSGLTVYDAAYLDLAIELRADLATLDQKLIAAARSQGITVL